VFQKFHYNQHDQNYHNDSWERTGGSPIPTRGESSGHKRVREICWHELQNRHTKNV
jgi:hypothetical protein